MSDIGELILKELSLSSGSIKSSDFASKHKLEAQEVVGAIKSLESLEEYIETEIVSSKKWILSKEGLKVMQEGSHEWVVYTNVPSNGISKQDLMSKCGDQGKIGFSKAMANGWIQIDKAKGGLIVRKTENVEDVVQSTLKLLHENGSTTSVDEKLKNDYKKRKLLEEVTEKIYVIKKGAKFSTKIKKLPTELTPEMIQSGSWKNTTFKDYNLNSLGVEPSSGFLHPLLKVRAEYRQIFLEMGFTEMPTNNYVESSFWNFDALFQPQQHPARDAHDTFFISEPASTRHFPKSYLEKVSKVHSTGGYGSQGYGYDWKLDEAAKNLLRTHTTAVSARMLYKLANQKDGFTPQKYFSIDKVFRNETLDATHLAEFHQIEGVIADRGLTLGDLIGVLYQFFKKLGIEKLRFKPAYNPYTEPSMEIFSYHEGLGKWVEIGNSGVFRPEMLLPMGLPEDVNVIAWGLSLERPTMIKYKIDNIRDLVGHKVNLSMVQSNPLCRLDKSNTQSGRQVEAVNKRFDNILDRLDILQQRVNIAANHFNIDLSTCSLSTKQNLSQNQNIVIQTPPTTPLHALKLMIPLLSASSPCYVSTHVHSSVAGASTTPAFEINTERLSRSNCPLKMTIIYKDVDCTTTIIAPGRKIFGEVNLMRYLARIALNNMYENHKNLSTIDQVLDEFSISTTKHSVTKILGCSLDSSPFLAGDSFSLADIMGLGLARCHNIKTPSVSKWINRCKELGY